MIETSSRLLPLMTEISTVDWVSFYAPFLLGMAMVSIPAVLVIEVVVDREV